MRAAGEIPQSKLANRVVAAAEAVLGRQKSVTPLDVFGQLGWLPAKFVDNWRQGRVDHLAEVLSVAPDKVAKALAVLHDWAEHKGLEPGEADYVSATRDRRTLRFTADGEPAAERPYRARWTLPGLSDAKRAQLAKRQDKLPDLVVVSALRDWTCADCGGTDDLLHQDDAGPLCLACADLHHLVFLPAGDAALTRRAKKASGLSAVVVRFNRSRKRYERQGILVEPAALERAEEECLADEDVRERRRIRDRERRANEDVELQAKMTAEIIRLFPGCPVARAEEIARHTAVRGSGRVGRSAAGRALDENALTRAVVASVRHLDTDYDQLLMSGVPRQEAREEIRSAIDRVLDVWRVGPVSRDA